MLKKTLLLAAVVTFAPAALLAADRAGPHPGPRGDGAMFKRLDTNQDGVITKDEAANAQRLASAFDQIDADHDGMITQDEMRAAGAARQEEMRARMQERWKSADKNGDGFLSREEVSAGMPRLAQRFDRLDANQDGQLSSDELGSAVHKHGRHKGRAHFGPERPGSPTQR